MCFFSRRVQCFCLPGVSNFYNIIQPGGSVRVMNSGSVRRGLSVQEGTGST